MLLAPIDANWFFVFYPNHTQSSQTKSILGDSGRGTDYLIRIRVRSR